MRLERNSSGSTPVVLDDERLLVKWDFVTETKVTVFKNSNLRHCSSLKMYLLIMFNDGVNTELAI